MKYFFVLFISMFILPSVNAQTDIENSKDYFLLDRMPEYSITAYSESEFDSHEFFYDGIEITKEGRKFVIEYRHNESDNKEFEFPTRLQLLRNYSNAIEKAGGLILFERYNSEHGYYTYKTSNEKEVWVQVKTGLTGKTYTLIVIEQENMRQDIVVDAELIKNKLEVEGKIAIYGIYFDTGEAIIKEESQPALLQIANYLKENPTVNCWVVGHTDSDGSFELNSKLSLERAEAILFALQKQYNIAENRLFAEGVGPLAPVASNTTEEGKQLNRRVELVKK